MLSISLKVSLCPFDFAILAYPSEIASFLQMKVAFLFSNLNHSFSSVISLLISTLPFLCYQICFMMKKTISMLKYMYCKVKLHHCVDVFVYCKLDCIVCLKLLFLIKYMYKTFIWLSIVNLTFQDFQKEIVKAVEIFATIGYRKVKAGETLLVIFLSFFIFLFFFNFFLTYTMFFFWYVYMRFYILALLLPLLWYIW